MPKSGVKLSLPNQPDIGSSFFGVNENSVSIPIASPPALKSTPGSPGRNELFSKGKEGAKKQLPSNLQSVFVGKSLFEPKRINTSDPHGKLGSFNKFH